MRARPRFNIYLGGIMERKAEDLSTWKDLFDTALARVAAAETELRAARKEQRQLERDRVRYLRTT